MKKTSFEDVLILNAAKVARGFFRSVPLRLSLAIGRSLGRTAYRFSPKKRRVARKNLRAAFAGEKDTRQLDRIARASFENMGMSIVELLRAPDLERADVERLIRVEGREKFTARLNEKKGVLFLTGHFGSWELLNISCNLLGYPMMVLARSQKHPRSDAFLNGLRTSHGGQAVLRGMGVRELLRALKEGKIVGVLSDQDGGKEGVFVNFFGRHSSSPAGVAAFSRHTGAPILPAFIFRHNLSEHVIELGEPLVAPAGASSEDAEKIILQGFAHALETAIRRAPGQWLWAHKRWRSTPDRSILVLSDGKAGHLNQSQAFVEAARAERRDQGAEKFFRSKVVEVRFRSAFRQKIIRLAAIFLGNRSFFDLHLFKRGELPFASFFLKWVLTGPCYHEIMNFYADVVVSCGAGIADVNWMAARENAAQSVTLMRPPLARRFDAVIAPRHDGYGYAKHLFLTEGTPVLAGEKEREVRAREISASLSLASNVKRIGVFIGGDTGHTKLSESVLNDVIAGIQKISMSFQAEILATTSRRTPDWAEKSLKKAFSGDPRCPLLVIANEKNPEGSAAGILGLADVIVVSGDSMSMVAEAVSSGKPVVVFHPSEQAGLKKKHRTLLEYFQKKEWLTISDCKDLPADLERALQSQGARAYASGNFDVLKKAAAKVLL